MGSARRRGGGAGRRPDRRPARSAREVARRVLRRVEGGAYASLALGGELSRAEISASDRRLATEITYGTLRLQSRLDRALGAYARRGAGKLPPPVRAGLRAAAYQILFLDRVPDHAAVDDAVDAARAVGGERLAGFANGLLRRLARSGEPPPPGPDGDPRAYAEITCALPGWIAGRLCEAVGADGLASAAQAFAEPAPLVARANTLRASVCEAERALAEEAREVRPWPLCPGAFSLAGIGDPEASPSHARGLWTVQDGAAQLVAHMLAPTPGDAILDACAGVGGKTTHLAQLAGGRARIDAVDASTVKLARLREAAERLGAEACVRPVCADARAADADLSARYGSILLDAPCTGLGVLRRHPEIKWRAGEGDVEAMAAAQRELLRACADRLAPGGALVYAVCTFTEEEGPARLRELVAERPELAVARPPARPGGPDWDHLLGADGELRTWPDRHGADAFYAVRLEHRGGG